MSDIVPAPRLEKLRRGDKVAVVSPSYAAPARWPHIYELGLKRLQAHFGLIPVSYPATAKMDASADERAADLIAAFENPEIRAVLSTLGGDDQVTYVKNLPVAPFRDNPKPYFGYSDNTHFLNHLWLNGVPSYYGGALFTEFARTPRMDAFTERYLRLALFGGGETDLTASDTFNDVGVDWGSSDVFTTEKLYEFNVGWQWDAPAGSIAEGITWGGCVESLDEILRHGVAMPSLEQFKKIVLLLETSEETPPPEYVRRVIRALGERGILAKVRGALVGRPMAWSFGRVSTANERAEYRRRQRETILAEIREYNAAVPVVQNLDFGHTSPQIPMPYGMAVRIDPAAKAISAGF